MSKPSYVYVTYIATTADKVWHALTDTDVVRRYWGGLTAGVPSYFYIVFLYGDVPDESAFLRTARSIWLEIKTDDVEEMRRKIVDSGVRKLDMPDPHLYFQTPGGQVLRLVGIDEDLSFYEGAGPGPNVAKVKEAVQKL